MIPASHLFFDIETLPTDRADLIADISASVTPPGSMKKAETIAAWEVEQKPAAVLEAIAKTSLDGGTGRLASIAWTWGDDPDVVAGTSADPDGYDEATERSLIQGFFAEADARAREMGTPPTLVGHNVAGFDIRWLWKRSIVLGVRIPHWWPIAARPWDADAVQDTMVMWEGARGWISQDRLARTLGLRGKGAVDGSQVAAMWAAGRFEEIREYNADDVQTARSIWCRITGEDDPADVMRRAA